MGAHRLVSMSTDPGRWALLCVHHQDGLHTAHVLLASAAALVIALGEDDGVLPWPQLRLSGSRTNWKRGPNAVLWAWPCTRNGDTGANFESNLGMGVLRLRRPTIAG